MIVFPPLLGADQETESCVAPAVFAAADGVGEETDGAAGAFGTVVIVTAVPLTFAVSP